MELKPKSDASKWYKTQKDTTDKKRALEAQQDIRDKLQQEIDKRKVN